jgi:hypothetical protein
MKYLICKKAGQGCDYSIGCGMTYEIVDFDGPIYEALKSLVPKIVYPDGPEGGCSLEGENPLTEAWIVPADNAFRVDVKSLLADHQERERLAKKAVDEAAEHNLYEKLRKKYSG